MPGQSALIHGPNGEEITVTSGRIQVDAQITDADGDAMVVTDGQLQTDARIQGSAGETISVTGGRIHVNANLSGSSGEAITVTNSKLVVIARTEYTTNESEYDATVADAWTAKVFDPVAKRIDIWCWDNGVTIARADTAAGDYQDDIRIDAGQFYAVGATTGKIRWKNTTGGSVGKIQIVAWY